MTRIASVKAHAVSAKLKHTLWTAHEELHSSSVVLVEIKTDDGLTGIGQIHGSLLKDICKYVELLGEVARGMDATALGRGLGKTVLADFATGDRDGWARRPAAAAVAR